MVVEYKIYNSRENSLDMGTNHTKNKKSLINQLITIQNKRHLLGWNYCSGNSNFREIVYWLTEIAVLIAFLIIYWTKDLYFSPCALVYIIKHVLLSIDYIYLIYSSEYKLIDILTNLNNIQLWVCIYFTLDKYHAWDKSIQVIDGNDSTNNYYRRPPVSVSNLYISPLVKLVIDSLMTLYTVLVSHRGGTNNEQGIRLLILDVQYLLFCLYMCDLITEESVVAVFTPILILAYSSLVLAAGLIFLIYKNGYVYNRLMNISLFISIVSGFVFCYSFKTYLRTKFINTTSIVCLVICIVSISAYAILKNSMKKLYYNLISVLYIENDFRLSPYFWPVKVMSNFVESSLFIDGYSQTEPHKRRFE